MARKARRARQPLKPPKLLTEQQLAIVRRAWAEGLTRDQVAYAAGITIHVLEARRQDQLADLPDRNRRVNSGRRGGDPSPDEIWGRLTHEIQSRWTDEEREEAWHGSRFRQ